MNRRQFLGAATAVAASAVLAPGTADARVLHDPTVRRWGPVGVIGDSLSTGSVPGMIREMVRHDIGPFRLDLRGGRSIGTVRTPFDSGLNRVTLMRQSGFDPPAWVIALGGNDLAKFRSGRLDAVTEIERMLNLLGLGAVVAWPTIWRKYRSWRPAAEQFNGALHDVATRRPNLCVVEWDDLLRANRQWFNGNVHLRGGGIRARNVMTAEAAQVVACRAAQSCVTPGSPHEGVVG